MHSLEGIRVLDLSRILAGPWCTQTLGDLGADVIKVERLGVGDDTRHWGPPFIPLPDGGVGEAAYYLASNRNKRSITCDIASAEGQALMRELAAISDVVVENYKVGDMARYGLDFASLTAINPKLVYCSITGFGQTGPNSHHAGYDYAIQAMGGLMSITGETDAAGGGPQKVGVAVVDLFTGMYATVAILAALRHAEATGQGQHIDMALFDTQVSMLANVGANHLVGGTNPTRLGNAHANIVPYQVFEVATAPSGGREFIVLAVGNDTQFQKFCAIAGHSDWALDARYRTNSARVTHRDALTALLTPVLLQRTKGDWLTALEAAQVPASAINDIAQVYAEPQIDARQLINTWHHPQRPKLRLAANPIKLSATPVRDPATGGLVPPLLGQDTDAVLQQLLGKTAEQLHALKQSGVL